MPQTPWHTLTVDDALATLVTAADGLPPQEAAARLVRYGPNRVAPARPASALAILVDQLTSLVVLLLVAAAVISLVLGDRIEAAAICAVLVLNAALGFVIDLRARRAMEALLQLDVARCTVVREGRARLVDASTVVPGDIVELDAGQTVPADGRLIAATDLRTMEASLTGESLPVSKRAHDEIDTATPLAERSTMVYKGTTIVAGTGRAVVTGTGPATELGRIGALVSSIEEERTPLERRLDELGRRLVWLVLAIAALVAGLGAWQGQPLALVIQMGIALAVAAVPEALPAVATIALAIGLRRMAARHALVRRLAAVEALGSTTVICSDKTRTLTSGDMTLVRLWTLDGALALTDPLAGDPLSHPVFRAALETAALASRQPPAPADAHRGRVGDPVDSALLRGAAHAGLDAGALLQERPAVAVVPFSSDRKLMATFTMRDSQGVEAWVKGAPGRVLSLCDRVRGLDGDRPLDPAGRARLQAENVGLAAQGLRVLALAAGRVESPTEAAIQGLTLLGFVGLMDPPAAGVKETIAALKQAGLRTIMLTGDQRATAEAVGRELGLLESGATVLDGRELQGLSAEALRDRLASVAAFSRIAPEDKLAVVRALQDRGEIVAMLGDGVNDAAALKKADVGVAMGVRGTDVAKEAASIVLQDDRFQTIAAAVEEGRVIYDNIRKFVFYLFSCNLAEVLVLLVAALVGLPLPLLPLQILWLNMVTDTFPALALALEPGDRDVMRRRPRAPEEAVLSPRFLGSITVHAVLITVSTLAAFAWALDASPARATTVAFMTLGLAQILHLGNARSDEAVLEPARVVSNPFALGAVVLSAALQLVSLSVAPIARLLGVVALAPSDWLVVLSFSAVPAVAGQAMRLWRRREA
jgi:Ca2+-transporting ATPase